MRRIIWFVLVFLIVLLGYLGYSVVQTRRALVDQSVTVTIQSSDTASLDFDLFGGQTYSDDLIRNHARVRFENNYGIPIADTREIEYMTSPLQGSWSNGEKMQGTVIHARYHNIVDTVTSTYALGDMLGVSWYQASNDVVPQQLDELEQRLGDYATEQCSNLRYSFKSSKLRMFPNGLHYEIVCGI